MQAEFKEVTLCKVADRHNADEFAVGVCDGHGLQFAFAHDFAEMTQRVVLADDGFALQRNVFDTRIQIREEQGLLNLEILQRVFGLIVHFAATGGHGVDAHSLFKVRVADCRANRIGVGISVPDNVHGFIAAFH